MHRICGTAIAASLALAPTAVAAADWWWVAGEPGSRDVYFVDTETIARDGAATWFELLHISQGRGADPANLQQVHCDRASRQQDDSADPVSAVRRFVCATPAERRSIGAMLGSIPPEVTANMIFQSPQPEVARR